MTIAASSAYAMKKDGRVSREEDSPLAEALTEALRRPLVARRVFGMTTPARMTWSFKAQNIATGEAVPVSVNTAPKPGEIGARISTEGAGSIADVTFPDGAFEVTATLSMVDRFGKTGRLEVVLSNVVVSSMDKAAFVRSLVRAAAELVGASGDEILRLAEQEPTEAIAEARLDVRLDRAQAVRALATELVRDRIVTLAELRTLVQAGRLFGTAG